MSGSITFASFRQEQEFGSGKLPVLLLDIIENAAEYAVTTWGWIFCVTSIFRTPEENAQALAKTAIHCYWRAVDIRTRGCEQEWIDDVTNWINDRFIYDPRRPALPVAYSAPHGDGPHLHLQVCEDTMPRPEPLTETV